MKFKFDHDLHIHSKLSVCSYDPEQTNERILQYAEDNGLSTICLTDHYWDATVPLPVESRFYLKQNYDYITQALPLPQADGVKFLFGCEAEFDKNCTLSIPPERYDDFDFIIIPTTHMHMVGLVLSEEDAASPETRAKAWVKRFEKLLEMPLPFGKIGIAHLSCPLINNKSREAYLETLDLIPAEDMERLFKKAADLGVGIELNKDMNFTDEEEETALRMYRIAKKCGCKFYCGSDAHHPKGLLEAKEIFERIIDRLELEESDKFHIAGI